jgi:uncharacterized protein (TIGR03437 family)
VNDTAAPTLTKNSTVHNFYPQPGAPLAPGTVVEIFGSVLAAAAANSPIPTSTSVNGTSVVIGGELAPLFYVSSSQINAQLPVDLMPGQEYQVLVLANGAYTSPDTIRIQPATPGVARMANGQAIAQHQDSTPVTPESPAKPGEKLAVYLEGMGLTNAVVASGVQSPATPLANVVVTPTVTLQGEPTQVLFAGLAPGFVGLYQINLQVPTDAQSGALVLQISQAGTASNVSILPVSQ